MLLYLIAYDIPDNKRRKKVADILEGYGQRVQYSVFEARLDKATYRQLQHRLRDRLNLDEDHLRIYPLTRHTEAQILVWGMGPTLQEYPRSLVI